MNALLIALGSEGDVRPLLRLGVALRGRGHQVSLAVNITVHFRRGEGR